jgi:hypothetical protein
MYMPEKLESMHGIICAATKIPRIEKFQLDTNVVKVLNIRKWAGITSPSYYISNNAEKKI